MTAKDRDVGMEYMTDRCCVVEFNEGSCCGFFWNQSCIIAHATFLAPFLIKNNFKEDRLEDCVKNKTVTVFVSNRSQSLSASVTHIWKAEKLSSIISYLLKKSAGWKFNDTEKADDISRVDKEYKTLLTLLPYFVLLKCNTTAHLSKRLQSKDLQVASEIMLGQKVHITSTPFGSVCPDIFLNSVTQGSVSQVVQDAMILTDAKCLPATEGAPVYTSSNKGVMLLGVVVAPLVWRHSEWLGLSVVCAFSDILNSLHHKHGTPQNGLLGLGPLPTHIVPEPLSQAVVLVKSLMSWGSGVLIHPHYILTCGHVVGNNKTVRIRQGVDSWQRAEVLYSSGPDGVYDLALLYIHNRAQHYITDIAAPKQGVPVSVVGHAVFGEDHQLTAMTTAGVVSKVLQHLEKPVLLQTSCTVQTGASGGAVVTDSGHLVGVVTSNAKDQVSKTCYPHLNMAVPAVTVWPVIEHYINTTDTAVLQNLLVKDQQVKNMWLLKPQPLKTSKVTSKL